jgi:hypothetical protein
MAGMVVRGLAAGAVGLLAVSGGAAAGESTERLLAPWQGEGQVFQIEPGKVMFLGRFDGILYADSGVGPFDGVPFVCPGTQVLDTSAGTVSSDGHCMLTPSEDEEVYARWSCAGQASACKGRIEFTGGTGRFEGISGGGEMTVRTVLADITEDTRSGEVVRTAAGIAVWPNLTYRLRGR